LQSLVLLPVIYVRQEVQRQLQEVKAVLSAISVTLTIKLVHRIAGNVHKEDGLLFKVLRHSPIVLIVQLVTLRTIQNVWSVLQVFTQRSHLRTAQVASLGSIPLLKVQVPVSNVLQLLIQALLG
jgi:hypothetical protein